MENNKIILNNGKVVTIDFEVVEPNHSFSIKAYDNKSLEVGYLGFTLYHKVKRKLSEIEKKVLKDYNSYMIDTDGKYLYKNFLYNPKKYKINGKAFSTSFGDKFEFVENFSEIELIEITDKKYLGTGLGHIMLNLLEEFCKEKDINKITGMFVPVNEFKKQTIKFYTRNNFTFSKEGNYTFITKTLKTQEYKTIQENDIINYEKY